MKGVAVQIRKDWTTLWPLVVLWWLVLIAATASTVQTFIRTDEFPETSVWPQLTRLVCFFAGVIFFVQDAAVDGRAFWRARPIPGAQIWVPKLFLLFVVFVIPGAAAQWWLTDYTLGYGFLRASIVAAAWLLMVILAGSFLGALTGSVVRSVMVLVGCNIALALLTVFDIHPIPHFKWSIFLMPVLAMALTVVSVWLLYRYQSLRRAIPVGIIAALYAWYAGFQEHWFHSYWGYLPQQYERLTEAQPKVVQPPDHPVAVNVGYEDDEATGQPVVQLFAEIQLPNISAEELDISIEWTRLNYPGGIRYSGRSDRFPPNRPFTSLSKALDFATESDIDPFYIPLVEISQGSYDEVRRKPGELELDLVVKGRVLFDTVDIAFSENPVHIQGKRNYEVYAAVLSPEIIEVRTETNLLKSESNLSCGVLIYNPASKEILVPPIRSRSDPWKPRAMLFGRPVGWLEQQTHRFVSAAIDHYRYRPSKRNSLGYRTIPGPVNENWLTDARIRVYVQAVTKPVVHTVRLTDFRAEDWTKAGW